MKVAIIGAGVSGITAAIELEKAGVETTILEKSDSVGGRVKTDIIDGVPFDHGFQVLLTEYPAAKEYLDLDALNLKQFLPGSYIFKDGKRHRIGDLTRDSSATFASILAPIGSFTDKRNILKLSFEVKSMSIDKIFSSEEVSTLAFLTSYGFSKKVIDNFFKPFFTGIFLEPDLNTSSRKFLFVYKMFAEGAAAIPNNGIQEIPKQLASKLTKSSIRLNTSVASVSNGIVKLDNSEDLNFDYVINAIGNGNAETEWHSCECLYFQATKSTFKHTLIGLITNSACLINNLHYVSDIQDFDAEKPILSVTIVNQHNLNESDLIAQVTKELRQECGIERLKFIKRYQIKNALPKNLRISYLPNIETIWQDDKTILAGDFTANGSLNAAMLSGKVAAQAVLAKMA